MALNIGKIKLGKEKGKRNSFNLDFDNTTTIDFGEIQPIFMKEMVPDTDMTVDVSSFVRLAPMPLPTYGRASYKTFHTFVPMQEIWDAWESFISKTSYTHGSSIYVPGIVPNVSQNALSCEVIRDAKMSIYANTQSGCTLQTSAQAQTTLSSFKANYFFDAYSQRIAPVLAQDVKTAVTLESADYVLSISGYVCAVRLQSRGARLRKILLGLGYQVSFDKGSRSNMCSILPLVAYYKAYFDIFNPQRDITWKSTSTYMFMETIELNNYSDIKSNFIVGSAATTSNRTKWYNFLSDLESCWFTDSMDFASAHIDTPAIAASGSRIATTPIQNTPDYGIQDVNTQPFINVHGSSQISQAQLNILKKLYAWSNKNTILGQRVAEYLKVHYGSDVLGDRKSNFIGNSNINIQISDVMSTSDTSDQGGKVLGEYGGKGVGYGQSNKLHFHSDCFGYWISMATVVPDSTFFQGIDPNVMHCDVDEFFTPAFDAVGYQVTPKACICGDTSVLVDTVTDNSASFGYIPRYTEYKVSKNIVNGDVSRRAYADDLLPYTLDKVISDNSVSYTGVRDDETGAYPYVTFTNNRGNLPGASTSWRYISGDTSYLTNFNRIFYNDEELNGSRYGLDIFERPDNFVIHNLISVKMVAPMLQISDSFETESNEDSISVQKS